MAVKAATTKKLRKDFLWGFATGTCSPPPVPFGVVLGSAPGPLLAMARTPAYVAEHVLAPCAV